MQEHYNNRSLFLVNSHPLYVPTVGSHLLNQIPQTAIKQVEVIRGPESVLYGTNAFSGVINIITKKPGEGSKGEAFFLAGSHFTNQFGFSLMDTIKDADVYLFAGVTGDLNPAHIDEEYAKNSFFKGRIAHGMLMAGFISTVVGTRLPGPGSVYVEQSLKFLAPVRFQATITARVEAIEINKDKNRVIFETQCINQDETIVVTGQAVISQDRVPEPV